MCKDNCNGTLQIHLGKYKTNSVVITHDANTQILKKQLAAHFLNTSSERVQTSQHSYCTIEIQLLQDSIVMNTRKVSVKGI